MPVQNIPLDWGTWIQTNYPDSPRYGLGSPRVGTFYPMTEPGVDYYSIFKFRMDGFSGQILSATLNVYCDVGGGSNMICDVNMVNKAANTSATWYYARYSDLPWTIQGCGAVYEDRSDVAMTSVNLGAVGWKAVPINLTAFTPFLNGQRMLIIRPVQGPTNWGSISLTNAPYLAVEYKTSLVGGVQIF